jgi:hypothetical protein
MTESRKELFSEKVSAGSRTYFFDVKESADGVKYLVISESRQVGGESHKHNRVMIFQEHLKAFNEGFNKAINFMMEESKSKAYNVEQIRREYPKAYVKWIEEEDIRLRNEFARSKTIDELAEIFQRKPDAIRSRLQKLGLL